MTVPPSLRKAGLSLASASREVSWRIPSSRVTPAIGTISRSNDALAAFWWLASANASCSARVMRCLSAISSAPSPSGTVCSAGMSGLTSRQPSVVETSSCPPAGNAFSGLGSTHGARVIDSTPPAITVEASPTAIAR